METPRVATGCCREAWEGFEGGRRQSRNRKKEQLVGKAWKRHASLLDAAGKRGGVLRGQAAGAGGSLGTVRKSCWLEIPLDAAACWKGLEAPRVATGRCREAWEGFEGGRRQSRNCMAGIYHWTLQLVGKVWKRHASLLDAAGRRGRVLRGPKAKLHTQGGPGRRPALARARQGRRI